MKNKLFITTRIVFWSFIVMWLSLGLGILNINEWSSSLIWFLVIMNPICSILHLCSIKDSKATPIWSLILTALWGVLLI